MEKKSKNRLVISLMAFSFMISFLPLALNSCGNSSKTETAAEETNLEDFYKTQPVESGLYDADYYDFQGPNPRKGHFDGRIYFSLSPELSAFYVFENGNRTKIDYTVKLEKPFEKNDSGIFVSEDSKNRPVSITPDSTFMALKFQFSNDTIQINFDPKPRHTGSPVEILEKMNAQKEKNKK